MGLSLAGEGGKGAGQVTDALVPEVVVKTMKMEKMTFTAQMNGRVAAFLIAEVRPQVDGIILKRLFEEGSDVKAGQPLYQIDPAKYEAQLERSKAGLTKTQASAELAKVKAARYEELLKAKAVSREDYDETSAAWKEAAAEVTVSEAEVKIAQINMDYTNVFAPISGRIGKSSVTMGALVTASQSQALATIQQLDPVYVDVTQSTLGLRALKRAIAEGTLKNNGKGYADVHLVLEDGQPYSHPGKILFADVTVDQTTGSISIRAEFPNPNHDLLPGMYAKALIDVAEKEQAISVPQQALTRNAAGEASVLVVAADGTVERRKVTTLRAIGDNYLIGTGLAAGEKVVVEGSQRIRFLPDAPPPKVKTIERN